MKITNKFKNLLVLLAFVVLFVQYSCVVRGKEGDFRMKVRAVFIKEDVERIKRSSLVLKVIVLEGQIPSEPIVDEEIYEQIRYGELGGKKFMERVTSFLLTTDQLKKCDNFYIWKVAGEEADLNCEKAVLIGNIDKQTEFKAVEGENLYYVDFSIPARDEKIYYIKIHTEDGGKIVKTFSRKFNYIPSMTAWVKLDINPTLFFFDFDGDTYPSGVSIYGINSFPNYVTEGQLKYSQQNGVPLFDCNDLDKNIHPEAQDACGDGIDSDCDGSDGFFVYEDKDQDGFASSSAPVCVLKLEDSTLKPIDLIFGFGDCDDSRAEVFPTAPLNCLDNFDNDCDGKVEFFAYRDLDGDKYSPNSVSTCVNEISYGLIAISDASGTNDCDDTSSETKPGAAEFCNFIDDNCNGQIDEGVLLTFYIDSDGDGYGSPSPLTQGCVKPNGYVMNSFDCNDSSSNVKPGAVEIINGVDDNCNGLVDEGAGLPTFYRDLDGDGFGNPASSIQAASQPPGYVSNALDCDDTSPAINPGTVWYSDMDGDGYSSGVTQLQCMRPLGYKLGSELVSTSGDCNDGDSRMNPGTRWYLDGDVDGYYPVGGSSISCLNPYAPNNATYVAIPGGDCNDNSGSVYPGAALNCNNALDEDCSGHVEMWYYEDQDGDGWTTPVSQCANVMPVGYTSVSNLLDCNDNSSSVYPGAALNCNNALDEDCSGHVEMWYYEDQDGDGWTTPVSQCANVMPLGYTPIPKPADCNDNSSSVYPGAALNCNNALDEDCSGHVEMWYYEDQDGDGWTTPVSQCANVMPVGYTSVSNLLDCNDNSSSVYPGAALNCNNALDEDCSGHVEMWYYEDQDGDGWTTPVSQCANVMPLGYTPIPKPADCNDNSGSVYPGAALNCNDVLDNDCSGNVESWGYTDVDGDLYAPNNVSVCVDLVIYPGMITVGSQLGLGDCNDSAVNINPSIPDNTCDGIDNNCNFYFDENTSPCYSPSLTVYSWGVSYATLRWEYPVQSSNVASFVLERSNDGVYFTQITFLPPSVTHYVDYTYSNMSKFYRVYAKNTTGSGPFSNVVSVEGFGAFAKSISGVGNDIAYGIVQVPLSLRTSLYLDGGYLIVGTTTSFGAGNEDIMVTKIHPSGATIYVRTLGGANIDRAYHITPAVETGFPYIGFLISGETYSFGGNCGGNCSDMLFVRFGADGSATPRFIGGSLSDIAFSSLQDYFGMSISYVVVGETYSFGQTCGGTCSDMMIVKLSNAFILSLALVIGGAQYDSAKAVVETSDGGYLVVGKTNSFGAGGYDIFAVKLTQAFGLVWAKTIGSATDDIPEYAIPTSDGGFIIVGASGVSPNRDVLITKIQSNGTVSWSRLVGGSGDDIAKSISPTKDGKYIVVGETSSFSAGKDIYLVKIDNSGNVEQTKTIGKSSLNEIGNFVIKNESGEILVVGTTNNFGNLDKYVLKLSEDGVLGCNENIQNSIVVSASFSENFPVVVSQFINPSIGTPAPSNLVQRPREYSMCYAYTPISIAVGGTGGDIPYQAVRTADDGLVVVGSTQISDSSGDMYILRFNSNLNLSWSKTLGALNTSDDARAVIQDSDGNFVIVGTYSPLLNRDAVVAKISSSGTTLWIRRIDYTTDDAGRGVVQTSDGGYLVLVRSNVASTSHDVILVKLDSNGNKIWAKRIYGSASDQPSSIIKTSDGYYIITGITQSFRVGSGNDGFIMKVDENGNLLWLKSIGGPQDDDAPSIVEAEDGNSIFLGSLRSSVGSDDYNIFFGKIDKDGGVIWKKVVGWGYSTSSHEYGHSISKTPDGNFIIVGRTDSIPPTSDIILIKFDTDGNILQMNLLGGGSNELGNSGSSAFSAGKASFVTRSDGKLILVASTDSFGNGLYDIYITEISENTCGLKNVQDIIVSAGGFDEFSTPLTADITVSVSVAPLTLSESSGGNVVGACGTLAPAPQLFADANENIFNYESRSDLFSGQRSSSGCSSFDLEAVVSIFVLLIVLRIRKLIYISQK